MKRYLILLAFLSACAHAVTVDTNTPTRAEIPGIVLSSTAGSLSTNGIDQVRLALSATGGSPLNIATSQIADFQTALAGGSTAFSAASGTATWATSAGMATTSSTASSLTPSASAAFATASQGLLATSARQTQPALKNVQAALTGSGVLRVALIGDSFVANASAIYRDQLARLFGGIAGYGLGMNYAVMSGGATSSTIDYASSLIGVSYTLPTGGSATFGGFENGGTVGTVCTTWEVSYKTTPDSGSFKIEKLNSSGSVTGTTVITATSSGTASVVAAGTIGWGLNKIRVTGLSGTCTILGCKMVDTYRQGGVIFEAFAIGGLSLSNMVTVPDAVLSPVVAAAAPDLYIFCMNDDAAAINTYLPQVITKLKAGYANSDIIFVGSHPNFQQVDVSTSETINTAANSVLKSIAASNHSPWIDSYALFGGSISVCNAAGLLDSGTVHLTTVGENLKTAAVIEQSGLAGLASAAMYRTPVFSQLAVPGVQNDASRLGGVVYFGRDDPRGYRAGALWFNDSNSSAFVDGGGSYSIENVSGTLQISKFTWSDNNRGNLRLFDWKGRPAVAIPQSVALVIGGTNNASTLPCITGGTGAPPATMVSGSSWSNNAMYVQTDATTPAWWVYQGGWKLLSASGRTAITGGTYTALASDDIIAVTGTAGAKIVLSGGFPPGKRLTIKDEGGNAAAVHIEVSGTTNGSWAGMGTAANYGVLNFYTDGAGWFTY